ncbi:11048_t:CDS:1 [Paraglomus brasilianum]|uniref:11048_t:CDS:1 n=1 Tax=Paraglomus brasilianum TaxID=144538 RepID=A0A9N9BBX0_9GLOM|nr:11048_t:CDS:1 [Paraglomus brasilianum]
MSEINALLDCSYKIKEEHIESKRINLETTTVYEDKVLDMRTRKTFKDRAKIARFVTGGLRSVQSDVLLMYYSFTRFNYPNLHRMAPSLKYADHLIERAKSVALLIRPYIAIYWRMESAKAYNLVNYSVRLVEYIEWIKKEKKMKNVYRYGPFTFNFYTWTHLNSSLPTFNNTIFLSIKRERDQY